MQNFLLSRTPTTAMAAIGRRSFASKRVKEIQRRHGLLEREHYFQSRRDAAPLADSTNSAVLLDEAVDAAVLGQLDSVAAAAFLRNNLNDYKSIVKQREDALAQLQSDLAKRQAESAEKTTTGGDVPRPFSAEQSLKVLSVGRQIEEKEAITANRGFFVRPAKGGGLAEEYTAAGADEMPENEMNELPFEIHGYNEGESVEQFDFQRPGQHSGEIVRRTKQIRKAQRMIEEDAVAGDSLPFDMVSNYGREGNVGLPPLADSRCSGCGAQIHCNNTSLPGFVPVEMFAGIVADAQRPLAARRTDYMCRRCFLYKEYNFLLNVNVCEIDYHKTMGHLKLVEEALLLLVVDMADLECSIHPDLPEIVGGGKPMIVIGNKTDLLPPDVDIGYLKRYHTALKEATRRAGFADKFNILTHSLISAKTGFGVEDLITKIYTKWVSARGCLRSDIYMLGCTNAGKSTLFNAFLQSDLCKVRAVDLVQRVTTSIWPGTTLSLLKFPIWQPSSLKLEQRRQRLLEQQRWASKESYLLSNMYKSTGDTKYITLQGRIENTFKETADSLVYRSSSRQMSGEFFGELGQHEVDDAEEVAKKNTPKLSLNNSEFVDGDWCYDTPGTVNRQQILDLFTLEELINVIPRSMLLPRTFLVYPRESLLIGGVARVDVLAAPAYNDHDSAVYLTVFASDRLPIHYLPTDEVDAFLAQYGGTAILAAPLGDAERLKRFPKLRYKKFSLRNGVDDRHTESMSDVLLSSVGWVSVTSQKAEGVQLKAWTPEARGLLVRSPLIRKPSVLKGRRIPGTNTYSTALPYIAETSIYQRGAAIHRPIELVDVQRDADDATNTQTLDRHPLMADKISFDIV